MSDESLPLQYVSPSSYARLRTCPYRVYLGRLHSRPDRAGRGVGNLGAAIHLAMERLVQTVDAHQPPGTFGALVTGLWDGALAEVLGPMASARSIPAYHLKLARLKNTANHLQELLADADHFHPEMQLGTSDHVLRGRADLVGYSATGTWILDYKSGVERDPTTGAAQVEDHFRQLRLYAAMLRDMDGNWPARLILLPLDGPPILQPVDAAHCEAEDHQARELMSRYNAILPDAPDVRIPRNSPTQSTLNSPGRSAGFRPPSEAASAADAKRQRVPLIITSFFACSG